MGKESKLNYQNYQRKPSARCWNCGEEGHKQHQCPNSKGMVNYGRESLANVHQKQNLTENHHSPSVIKVALFSRTIPT